MYEQEAGMNNNGGDNSLLSTPTRQVIEDLAALGQSLLAISEQSGKDPSASNTNVDLELASELKSVVDALRMLFCAYAKALSAKSEQTPREVLSWYKMQLAVEMLRTMRARPEFEADSISEFERLINGAIGVASRHPSADPRWTEQSGAPLPATESSLLKFF
jgi:hypothetical protein